MFVTRVKKDAPTKEYMLTQLQNIPDEIFTKNIADLFKGFLVDDETPNMLAEKTGIDTEKIECLINLTRNAMRELSRGMVTTERLEKKYLSHLSQKKKD